LLVGRIEAKSVGRIEAKSRLAGLLERHGRRADPMIAMKGVAHFSIPMSDPA
jgi:hypothetical protein